MLSTPNLNRHNCRRSLTLQASAKSFNSNWLKHLDNLYRTCKATHISLALFLMIFSSNATAMNEGLVTVHLFEVHSPMQMVAILPPFRIIGSDGNKMFSMKLFATVLNGKVCLTDSARPGRSISAGSSRICLQGINTRAVALALPPFASKHRYRGTILLSAARDGSLAITNIVSNREYIEGVVAAEAPLKAPLEMLKAQAILAQTLLLKRGSDGIGDSTESQCYLGADLERASITTAVASVKGRFLKYKGAPIIPYYHSTCAGGTSAGATYFHLQRGKLPFLSAVKCTYCQHSPFWAVTEKSIPYDLFSKFFGEGIPTIVQTDYTKRPLLIKLGNGKTVSGYDFWIKLGQSFGWDKAPGTRYALKTGKNKEIIIESTGAGHGLGLCQWGASSLAKNGKNYREILQYYFPDCEIP